MPTPTLYQICLDYIKGHTEDLTSLEGVPFYPTIESIIDHLFRSAIPLNSSILSVIANSHSKELREAGLQWTRISLSNNIISSTVPALAAVAQCFPRFITCLDFSHSTLSDDHIHLLGRFSNLKILHLGWNLNITDRGISYLANVATCPSPRGLHFLIDLRLNDMPYITDKSLKYIGQLNALTYLDISHTDIIEEVALKYLPTKGFKRDKRRIAPSKIGTIYNMKDKIKFYTFIRDIALKYDGSYANRPVSAQKAHNSFQNTLQFSRNLASYDTHLTTAAKKRSAESISVTTRKRTIKNQRLSTDDFLTMIENELAEE